MMAVSYTHLKKDIARLRKKTAFVFQNYNLFRNKTAVSYTHLRLRGDGKYVFSL